MGAPYLPPSGVARRDVEAVQADVDTLTSDLADVTSDVADVTSDVGDNTTDIATNTAAIAASAALIATAGTDIDNLEAANTVAVVAYAASVALDVAVGTAGVRKISLTGDLTFAALTNQPAGTTAVRRFEVQLLADGSERALAFPAWVFVGSKPTTIAAGKTGLLELFVGGPAAGNVIARYTVEA